MFLNYFRQFCKRIKYQGNSNSHDKVINTNPETQLEVEVLIKSKCHSFYEGHMFHQKKTTAPIPL